MNIICLAFLIKDPNINVIIVDWQNEASFNPNVRITSLLKVIIESESCSSTVDPAASMFTFLRDVRCSQRLCLTNAR
jgi:hypothetical protein